MDTDTFLFIKKVPPTYTNIESLIGLEDSFKSLPPKLPEAQRQVESRREFISYQNLGTHFSPLVNLAELPTQEAGFVSGSGSLAAYSKQFSNRKFYNTSMPFTSFRYSQGAEQYLQFDGLHTQNIIPTWNVAAGIQSFTNKGYGLRQLQVHRAPFVTSHFTLPNNRFRVMTSLNWVRRSGYVNGGLSELDSVRLGDGSNIIASSSVNAYDSLTPGVDRNSLPGGLKNAVDTVNFTNHFFRFQYHFGNKYFDTIDSIQKLKPLMALYYQLHYKKEVWLYNDDNIDSAYYSSYFNNYSNSNRDSQVFKMFRNELGFEKFRTKINGFSMDAHLAFEQGSYTQNNSIRITTFNTAIGAGVKTNIADIVGFKAKGEYYIGGYNQGDYYLTASGLLTLKKAAVVGNIVSQLYEPSPQHKYFTHSYFQFVNRNFNKVLNNELNVTVVQNDRRNPIRLHGKIQNLTNYVYFDNSISPVQNTGNIQFLQLSLGKRFNYKNLNARVDGFAQQVAGLNLPNWACKLDAYYQKPMFDSAVTLKAGADLFYTAKYNSLGYMPMLRQFYFNSGNQLGNYPLLDLYVAGEIKTFTFFLKMENVLNGFMAGRAPLSYYTYAYPMQPMAFRLGLLWDFYY